MTECVISGNTADRGGGIQNSDDAATLTLDNSVVSGNSAVRGGGISNQLGAVHLTNGSRVNGANTATFLGGGIYNQARTTLDASSVTDNRANADGGGIFNAIDGTVDLQNGSNVSGNTRGIPPEPSNCAGDGAYTGETCPA